ncbi:hypothetical protein BDV95DRAFT_600018 [Massariosphaeria phaeospora]|uniref:F-box domain-containing protein n=1 Tax=Massariosphaeria phaeospora TaxID=100035 RepID=A0A7C8M0L5_9PLEO|nr:hypothetical protein BDV95DRAFT_600018 [Massariosphaeria phaeospora]
MANIQSAKETTELACRSLATLTPGSIYLPDELIVKIVNNLQASRKFHVQDGDLEREGEQRHTAPRAVENRSRRATLWALCLTSKRLYRISAPVLYSAVVIRLSQFLVSLELVLLHRTMSERPALATNISYVECLGGSIHNISKEDWKTHPEWRKLCEALTKSARLTWHGETLQRWNDSLHYRTDAAHLALLILATPNIEHMSLDIRGVDTNWVHGREPGLLDFIGLTIESHHPPPLKSHGFAKLERLSLEGPYYEYVDLPVHYNRSLQKLPVLRHYQHAAACPMSIRLPPSIFGAVNTLHLVYTDNSDSYDQIAEIVRESVALKEFSLAWYEASELDLQSLSDSLAQHEETLEYLEINWHESCRFDNLWIDPLKSLAGFKQLTSLVITDLAITGIPNRLDKLYLWVGEESEPLFRISAYLPRSLKNLILIQRKDWLPGKVIALWELADNLANLPNLRYIHIVHVHESDWDLVALTERFLDRGVEFSHSRKLEGRHWPLRTHAAALEDYLPDGLVWLDEEDKCE